VYQQCSINSNIYTWHWDSTKGIFLISSRKPDLGEMSDLLRYVEENIDGFKAQALLFSLDSITKEIVERKYKMLKKRLVIATVLAAGVAASIFNFSFDFWYYHLLVFAIVNRAFYICVDL
jgi:hypothetical protein